MKQLFGRDSQRVLALIIRIADLSPAEVDQVTNAWKQISALDRARAWARLTRATTEGTVPDPGGGIPRAQRGPGGRPSAAPDGLGVLGRRERRRRGCGCRHPNRPSLRDPDRPASGGYACTGPTPRPDRRPHDRVRPRRAACADRSQGGRLAVSVT